MLKPYTGDEVAVAVDAAREQLRQRLGDRTRQGWFSEAISAIETSRDRILAASLNRRFGSVAEALRSSASNAVKSSAERISGLRSEERRVGKECVSKFKSWWATHHEKKKKQLYLRHTNKQ